MNVKTVEKLNKVNAKFYKKTAKYFDSSRQYSWEGWDKFWDKIYNGNLPRTVLDVGCGNGRFVSFLQRKLKDFEYLGVDNSIDLLRFAEERYKSPSVKFQEADLLAGFDIPQRFDLIVVFGVMHHIPGRENRINFLKSLGRLLNPSGHIVFSVWKFLESEKQKEKIVEWKLFDIKRAELEENDFLLTWNRGEHALRYCHYMDDKESSNLINKSELKKVGVFKADGKDGKLNEYFILKKS